MKKMILEDVVLSHEFVLNRGPDLVPSYLSVPNQVRTKIKMWLKKILEIEPDRNSLRAKQTILISRFKLLWISLFRNFRCKWNSFFFLRVDSSNSRICCSRLQLLGHTITRSLCEMVRVQVTKCYWLTKLK